jgi:dTDP-glucose 4,6-dehydratase
MRAVITGGAGFLGSHLCDYLIERGWDVLSIDNSVSAFASSSAVARTVNGVAVVVALTRVIAHA